ncbi:MAG: hypothetical protein IKV50_00935 [Clostridia bacterium]|nr:hypothetical protein [Clostridia bacterium]MBR6553725.1 hypothetical protein [Clostridia bacterium]
MLRPTRWFCPSCILFLCEECRSEHGHRRWPPPSCNENRSSYPAGWYAPYTE